VICGGLSGTGIGFSPNSSVSLSISFHHGIFDYVAVFMLSE
jgi:hypothetical protein